MQPLFTPTITKYEAMGKQPSKEGVFSTGIPPITHLEEPKNNTILIYAGTGNFNINLDFCMNLNQALRKAGLSSYYVMQKTYPKAVISMALNDGIETVIGICTTRNNSVPALNGQELFTTSRKSYLLGTYIAEAIASNELIRAFPKVQNEPSNSPSWTAARSGLTLVRISLGYLSNYYDADLIVNHKEELSRLMAQGIGKYQGEGAILQ